jgi:hypothetical protein
VIDLGLATQLHAAELHVQDVDRLPHHRRQNVPGRNDCFIQGKNQSSLYSFLVIERKIAREFSI